MSALLTVALAASAAATAAALARTLLASTTVNRSLADYFAAPEGAKQEPNTPIGKEAVILVSLGLPPDPRYLKYLQVGLFAAPALATLLLGFPAVLALGAGALGFTLGRSYLEGRWHAFRLAVERDLPAFVARLAGVLAVTENARTALAEVTATLPEKAPLRLWMERFLAGLQTRGAAYAEEARREAMEISPSLALTVFMVGRLAETGGGEFAAAFTTVADELSAILEARAVAGSKVGAARQNVHLLLAILGFIALLTFRQPQILAAFRLPGVQFVTIAALGVMAFGYQFMDGMIREAME